MNRRHIHFKLFWFLTALNILNLSVDAPDPQPYHIPEDLRYNDMESIVEIVLEQVLGIEDAVPEHDDDDATHGLLMHSNLQLICHQEESRIEFSSRSYDVAQLHMYVLYKETYADQIHPEIILPPPQV